MVMAKVSKDSAAQREDRGPVLDCWEEVGDGMRVDFLEFRMTMDGTPLLKGLPGDQCTCAHWGYVTKGRLTFRIDGRDEVYEAGDAFYVAPGHIPIVEEGLEYVQFSPAEELEKVSAVMTQNFQRMQEQQAPA
jgi:hypothetical protein